MTEEEKAKEEKKADQAINQDVDTLSLRLDKIEKGHKRTNWLQWGTLIVTGTMAAATLGLVIVTYFMALTMREDFIVRNTPRFLIATPSLKEGQDEWLFTFEITNKSKQGIANDTLHFFVYHSKDNKYIVDTKILTENERTYNIPFDYAPGSKRTFSIRKYKAEYLKSIEDLKLESIIVILIYSNLLEKSRKAAWRGFVHEGGGNFVSMPQPMLEDHKSEIRKQRILRRVTSWETGFLE